MTTKSNPLLWWQRGVIYQVYPRSFQDSSGDGIGDLAGIRQRLDYLGDVLGVDAIWLSPFYPSPMKDFGYDVSLHTDVDRIFGTLADFKDLVHEAHRREIKIIVDFVPNHTSDQHQWFRESRSSRTNPRRDWYVWRDAKPNGSPPNNWLSLFGGSAWEWDETTGQYYLHSFLKEQPDLNWRNPAVKEAMLDVLRFWLDLDVDGFRIDVAHFIMKDPELRDNPPNPVAAAMNYKPMGEYDTQLHVHDVGHPDVHAIYRGIRLLLDQYSAERPRMSLGEIHIFDLPTWAAYYGTQLDEIHMPFNFGFLKTPWSAAAVRQFVDSLEAALPAGGWPNFVLGNHDESRIASRIGQAQARVAMMLLLTLRGTPTMYYGDEIGMHDVPIPPESVCDPWGQRVKGFGLGRDPERTPMQWDAGPNAGFCPPDVKPWLPIAADYRQFNVASELADPHSMLSLTRRLLAVRRASEALTAGIYRSTPSPDTQCFLFQRETESERVLVALNLSHEEQQRCLPNETGTILASTRVDRHGPVDLDRLTLRPDEGLVIQLEIERSYDGTGSRMVKPHDRRPT